MIIRTQAIALQIRPWSQTSHMVTWLTPGFGRVVTSVKGACRPKSAFLGQYDLFYTCDLLFYRRERDGVHAIRECAPLALREPLRRHWRHAAAAAYLADLAGRVIQAQQEAAAHFRLLEETLDRLADAPGVPPHLLLLWHEAHLLRLLGLQPDFTACPLCHTPDRPWRRFSLDSGRFLCPHLAQPQPGEQALSLHRDVQALFLALCQCETPPGRLDLAPAAGPGRAAPQNLVFGLSRFLGIFLSFHLEVPSAVRRVTFEMLDSTHAQNAAQPETLTS